MAVKQEIMLHEAIDQIMNSIRDTLKKETEPMRKLDGVKSIVRGDRARPRPPTPAIWIFNEVATPAHNPTTILERWTIPIVLAAIVKTDKPDFGYMEASRLAALARSAVLKDRTLGLREFVQDTRSGRYELSGPWHNEGQLYGSVAVVEVTFLTYEKEVR